MIRFTSKSAWLGEAWPQQRDACLARPSFGSKQSAGQRYRPDERSGLPKLG